MKRVSSSLARRLAGAFDRPKFFRFIVFLLVAQAAWIALSGSYPMAFDEDFHLGIIRLYAHHIGPFWAGQPENADMFGAVARDPSYLYQYLMSFPYRLISLFTQDQTIQVLILRFINIGLFAWGLALYRKLLLKTGVSRAQVHVCLVVFVLIPIVPLLAAQINYDNLFLPITALALLMTVKLSASLTERKHLDAALLAGLLALCMLASLVKYAFLPLFVVIFIFLVVRLWQVYGSPGAIRRDLYQSWSGLSCRLRVGLLVAIGISGMLFIQRYGVNLVVYHAPVPDCSKVLTVEQCSEYGPWIRDYNLKLANIGGPRSLRTFSADWFYGMWLRTFFAVGGPGTDFETRGPLLIPGMAAIIFAFAGMATVAMSKPGIFKRYDQQVIRLFVAVAAGYAGVLWLDDYQAYLRTSQPVAINGRYLLPVLLPSLIIVTIAVSESLKKRPRLKIAVATLVLICLAWGGGALTFILRSNNSWYWPNQTVRTANADVRQVLGPLTPGYHNPVEFLR